MTKSRSDNVNRLLFFSALLLVMAGIWPVIGLFNRIEPFIFGLPTFLFYMLSLNVIVAIYLAIAYRLTK